MKKILIILLLLYSSHSFGQILYESIPKKMPGGIYIQIGYEIQLFENNEFVYRMTMCGMEKYSTGNWVQKGDSLILTSHRRPGEYVAKIAQFLEFKNDTPGIKIRFENFIDEEQMNTSYTMGIDSLPLIVYSNGEEYNCTTDTSGKVKINGIEKIDSVRVGKIIDGIEWMIYPSAPEVNLIIVRFDLWDWLEEGSKESNCRFFTEEKWVLKNDTLYDPQMNIFYKGKK